VKTYWKKCCSYKTMVKLTLRVNFINQLELSANALAHIFTNVILFHQQNCAQLYQCISLEFTPNFVTSYAVRQKDQRKSTAAKATCKRLVKLTPAVDFTNMLRHSFYVRKSQKQKRTFKSSVSFCAFGICARQRFT